MASSPRRHAGLLPGGSLDPQGSPRGDLKASGSISTFGQLTDAWPELVGDAIARDVRIVGMDFRGALHLSVCTGAELPLEKLGPALLRRLPASVDGVAVRRIVWHGRPSAARTRGCAR